MQHSIEFLFSRYRQTGKARLLGEVYDATSAKLWPLALQITRDHALAEDLVQGTYLLAMEHREDWDDRVPLLEWLTSLLAQCHLEPDLPAFTLIPEEASRRIPSVSTNPVSEALAAELDHQLCEALQQLPQHYREVLELKIREGKDSAAIGAIVGKSPGTVRSQIARGLERLRMLLPTTAALAWLLTPGADGAGVLAPSKRVRESLLPHAKRLAQPASPVRPTRKPEWLASIGVSLVLLGAGAWWFHQSRGPHARVDLESVAYLPDAPRHQPTASELTPHDSARLREAEPQAPAPVAPANDVHLFGQVLDEQGLPVEGAKVQLFSWKDWRPDWQPDPLPKPSFRNGWQNLTDAHGHFSFEVPTPQGVHAIVEVDAGDFYARESLWLGYPYSGLPALQAGDRDLGILRLQHAGVLEAQLLDAQGQAVPWAGVHVWPGQNHRTGSLVQSDAHGRVRLPKVIPGWQSILITHELCELRLPPMLVQAGQETPIEDWSLPPLESVRLSMEDPNGAPVADVAFAVVYPGPPRLRLPHTQKSDRHGELWVELPVGVAVWLEARLSHDLPVAQRVMVRGPDEHYRFVLPRPSAAHLTVVDDRTGEPVPQVHVQLKPTTGRHKGVRTTTLQEDPDDAGRWPLPFEAEGELSVAAEGYLRETRLLAGRCTDQEIRLRPAPNFAGRVTWAGQPQAGVRIEVTFGHDGYDLPYPLAKRLSTPADETLARSRQVTTDEQGRFQLPIDRGLDGQFLLHAIGAQGGWQGRLRSSDWSQPIEIELEPYASLQGQAWLPAGLSPGGLTVFLNASRGTLRATLDTQGRFSFPAVPAGTHRVQMLSTPHLHGRQILAELVLAAGQHQEITIDLTPLGKTGASVRVQDAQGEPVAGAYVALVPVTETGDRPPGAHVLGRTHSQGLLLGQALGKGLCRWWVLAPNAKRWQVLDTPAIEVTMDPLPATTLVLP